MKAQLNRIVDAQDKRAGIFESPSDVGNGEIPVQGKIRARDPHHNGNCDIVVLAMKAEGASDFDMRIALRLNAPFNIVRGKSDLRVHVWLSRVSLSASLNRARYFRFLH